MKLLLVHHDEATREVIAQALRLRELVVDVATTASEATELAGLGEHGVVLVSRVLAEATSDGLGVIDALALELLSPPPVVVLATPHTEASPAEAHEHDIDRIVQRVREVSSPGRISIPAPPAPPSRADTPVGTLLATLSAERRSGSLAIATRTTRGVVCFVGGQIVDALYGRHQGDKALARLLEVTGDSATFLEGNPGFIARIDEPTATLLARAGEKAAAFSVLSSRFGGDLSAVHYVEVQGPNDGDPRGPASLVLERLRGPLSLARLLDEVPGYDADILEALASLEARGRVRRLDSYRERAHVAPHTVAQDVRAAAATSRARGFSGLGRVVLAVPPMRVAAVADALRGLVEAVPPEEPAPHVPVPHTAVEVRLGEGVALEIVMLPLVAVYAPLWPLTVAGARAVIVLEGKNEPLAEACAAVGRTPKQAEALVSPFDASSSADMATLLRAALDVPS